MDKFKKFIVIVSQPQGKKIVKRRITIRAFDRPDAARRAAAFGTVVEIVK